MSAKNRVINGDYAGSQIVGGGAANAAISLGIIKQLRLNSSTVESYEVLGGVAGAVSKNGYQVKIIFKDASKQKNIPRQCCNTNGGSDHKSG